MFSEPVSRILRTGVLLALGVGTLAACTPGPQASPPAGAAPAQSPAPTLADSPGTAVPARTPGAGSSGQPGPAAAGGTPVPGTPQAPGLPVSSGPGSAPRPDAGSAAVRSDADPAAQAAADKAAAEEEAAAKAAAKAAAEKAAALAAVQAEHDRLAALAVPPPSLKTGAGVYPGPVTVALDVALKEAKLSYTLDGTEPGEGKGLVYSGPVKIGSSTLLKVRAYVPGYNSSETVSAEYTIAEVCAAPGGTGDGRRDAPAGTLAQAAGRAASLGIKTVKLAAGTFEESAELAAPLLVSGGWKADFSAKAPDRTLIKAKPAEASSKKLPSAALVVRGKAADAGLKVERVDFRGGAADYSAGILVLDGAAPEFTDCSAVGGPGSYGYGAVVSGGSAPLFRLCRLNGGAGATSYGLSVDGAQAQVQSCYVVAGTGTVGTYGLAATDGRVGVASSVVAGGAANVSYGAAFYNSKGSRLENCTVWGGKGKDVSGIFLSASDPAVENCIVAAHGAGKSFGITANYGESAPSSMAGNLFLGCSGGTYWDAGAKTAYGSFDDQGRMVGPDGKAVSRPSGEGNGRGAFALGNDWQAPKTAVLPAVKALAGPSATDVRGKTRSEPRYPGAFDRS